MNPTEKQILESKLDQLIHISDRSVGMDRKRINYKITELQNQIDCSKLS